MTELAWRAGEGAKRMQAEITSADVDTKETDKDVVSKADKATETLIRSAIADAFPDHGFFGEETGRSDNPDSEFLWIVDPIDGTTAYLQQELFWCTSIGLWKDGKPYAGAIYAPALNELYYAELGKGATLNGRPIHVRYHGALNTSVVVTGFSCLRANWEPVNNLKYFGQISRVSRGVRRFGSAAMDMCNVANGRVDAFWELNLKKYDVAAGVIITTEAGGKVTDLLGGDDYPHQGILATNVALHDEMLSFFEGYQRPRNAN